VLCKVEHDTPAVQTRYQKLWDAWADYLLCDFDEVHNFYGLQDLVTRTIHSSGEVFVQRVRKETGDVAMELKVFEGDLVPHDKNEKLKDGGYIIQGVEFSSKGKRVAYWVLPVHPGDAALIPGKSNEPVRIPATEIIHLFKVKRPGQVRGMPTGTTVIIKMRDFEDLSDAQLLKQKIAACFVAFRESTNVDPKLFGKKEDEAISDKLEPGAMEDVPEGKKMTFANPPTTADYPAFAKWIMHEIAAGYGLPYELLTGDLSNVNFSSAKYGWNEFNRQIEAWRWKVLIPRFCEQVFKWFKEAVSLTGARAVGVTAAWTPPRREMIDPTREVPAMINEIRGGTATLSEKIREKGNDPEKVFKERAEDNAKLDKLGIVLDSDPRTVSKSGLAQQTPPDLQDQAA